MGTPSCHRASPSRGFPAPKIPVAGTIHRDLISTEPGCGDICVSRGRKPAVGCESGAESRSGSIHLVSGGRARLQPRQNLCLGNRAFSPGANSVAKAIPPAALVRWAEAQPFHRFLRSNSWDARLGTACPDRSVLCPVVQAGANRAAKRRRCIETGAQAPGRRMNSSEPRSGDIQYPISIEAQRLHQFLRSNPFLTNILPISIFLSGLCGDATQAIENRQHTDAANSNYSRTLQPKSS